MRRKIEMRMTRTRRTSKGKDEKGDGDGNGKKDEKTKSRRICFRPRKLEDAIVTTRQIKIEGMERSTSE